VGPSGGFKAQLTKQQLIETAVEKGLGLAEIARLLERHGADVNDGDAGERRCVFVGYTVVR
jgi:hypothetical protein